MKRQYMKRMLINLPALAIVVISNTQLPHQALKLCPSEIQQKIKLNILIYEEESKLYICSLYCREFKEEAKTLLQRGMSSCRAFIFSFILSLRLCGDWSIRMLINSQTTKTVKLSKPSNQQLHNTYPFWKIMDLRSTRSLCGCWTACLLFRIRRLKFSILGKLRHKLMKH